MNFKANCFHFKEIKPYFTFILPRNKNFEEFVCEVFIEFSGEL